MILKVEKTEFTYLLLHKELLSVYLVVFRLCDCVVECMKYQVI